MKAKKISIKTVLKVVWILFGCLSFIIWLPKADKMLTGDYSTISEFISLDDGWDITINDDDYQNVSLGDFRFESVNKGDQIVMQRVLPTDWNVSEGALRLYIRHSAVRMYIDDELIYEYGYERISKNKAVGSGFQFVNFPKEYEGKTLKIHLYLSEDKVYTKLESIRIYEWANAYRVLMTENRLPMLLGGFLLIFGLSTCAITICAVVFSLKYLKLLCVSVFSICVGLWTLCYYNVFLIFSIPLYSISLMENLSLYLAPIPIVIYMHEDVMNLKNKVFKVSYWVLLAGQIIGITVMVALHTMDIVHLAAMLQYMQVLIIVCLVYFILIVVLNLKENSPKANRMFLAGMLVIAICVAYDLVTYYENRYMGKAYLQLKGVSSLGMMVFIFILIVSFYMKLTEKLMQETERNFLIKSAYTDELTQIHNRRYCMEYMNKIKEEKIPDYSVICFDLNNLKVVNDTYGHAQGDTLIKSAADVIAKSFEKDGIVARMGGDEFIAVLTISDTDKLAMLLKQFEENIRKKNQEVEGLNMSIAYGYASGDEEEGDITKTFQTADARMYDNKMKMKGSVR